MSDRIRDVLSIVFLLAGLAATPLSFLAIERSGIEIELAQPPLLF
jgi:hypothetical protein